MHAFKHLIAVVSISFICSTQALSNSAPYDYHVMTKRNGEISYTFTSKKKPELIFKEGNICNASSVNETLRSLNLPEVKGGVSVQSLLTGHRSHRSKYVWEDYSLGTLKIVSAQCGDQSEPYECIWQVKISS